MFNFVPWLESIPAVWLQIVLVGMGLGVIVFAAEAMHRYTTTDPERVRKVQGNIWQTWVIAIAVALFATGLEAFSKLGIDNITVPLGSAALSFALTQLLLTSQ